MIRDDKELAVTRERVAKFERLLEELRNTARPEEWPELNAKTARLRTLRSAASMISEHRS